MRIFLACGGRDFEDERFVRAVLMRHLNTPDCIVFEGGALGADTLIRRYCRKHGIDVITVWANWERWKRRAGPIRNGEMLRQALALAAWLETGVEALIVFPGGVGTANMVTRARRQGITVYDYREERHEPERTQGAAGEAVADRDREDG